jgi:hypothetical protein
LSETILHVYDGGLNSASAIKTCGDLESRLIEKKLRKPIVKRCFFLALEIIQNQLLHGAKDNSDTQHNYFIASSHLDKINFHATNLVYHYEVVQLTERIKNVNAMLLNGTLREHYLEQLTNDKFSAKGGGGLGFIKMALVTEHPIEFQFQSCGKDFSFLILKIQSSITTTNQANSIRIEQLFSVAN